jgi:DNA-binding transcriptional LysR family regulator
MPSVKELEAFMAVLEAGSFEGAARRLNATSPAVSKRILELESELGVRLFERTTRRCHITLRGSALVPFAQRVLADISEIQRTVGERCSLTGHVRLGMPETIAYTLLPKILQSVSADLPQLTLGIEAGPSMRLMREVQTREMDIAFVAGPVLDQDLVSEPFCEVPLSWIAAGPTWTEEPLTIDELATGTILLPARGRHVAVVEGWFKSRGVRVKQIIKCNSLAMAVKLTTMGMGLSLVPIECARRELDARVVTPVPVQMQLPTNSYVITYPAGQIDPLLAAFINVMRMLASTLMTQSTPYPHTKPPAR